MKREACHCQHCMYRTHFQPSSKTRSPEHETRSDQRLNLLPATGLFSDVTSKPTNHSNRPQYLESHLNPFSKSMDKPKGAQKLRKRNMIVSPRLITWRVIDRRPGLNFSGFSTTEVLEHLYGINDDDNDEIGDHENDDLDNYDDDDDDDGGPCGFLDYHHHVANFWSLHEKENESIVDIEEYVYDDHKIDNNDDDDDDGDDMNFCDVAFMVDQTEEDEGWCLLGEM